MVILAILLILRRRQLGEGETARWWILRQLGEMGYDLWGEYSVLAVGQPAFFLLAAVPYDSCSERSWATGWATYRGVNRNGKGEESTETRYGVP